LREARGHRLLVHTLSAGSDRFGFRLIEYSVQSNHFHMLVEVDDQLALTRGAKGLLVRLARALNKLWGRKGSVFPERYHVRALQTPTEVRRALVYVLHNARRHGAWQPGIDPHSSGPWFDGYVTQAGPTVRAVCSVTRPVDVHARVVLAAAARAGPVGATDELSSSFGASSGASSGAPRVNRVRVWPRSTQRPRSWLLAVGWRRLGLLDPEEAPELWHSPRTGFATRVSGKSHPASSERSPLLERGRAGRRINSRLKVARAAELQEPSDDSELQLREPL
jgi:REP element-mobilizing transposase RayT